MASKRTDNLNMDFEPEEFSLEDILAEYGGSRSQKLMEDVERSAWKKETVPPMPDPPAPKRPKKAPPPELSPQELARDKLLAQAVDLEKLEKELPLPPRPVSLEEVVGSTVSAVMMEEQEPLLKPRRSLFSRRKLEETEQLYDSPEPEPEVVSEPIGPEPELSEAAAKAREEFKSRNGTLLPAFFLALIPTALLAAEEHGLSIPYWTGNAKNQTAILLALLVLAAVLCRGVFTRGVKRLGQKRFTGELLVCLAALANMGDCVVRLSGGARTDVGSYAAVSCLALFFAQWGTSRVDRGMYETFRSAGIDAAPPDA